MGHNDDLFSPEGIDAQIEQHQPARSQPTPSDQLMHDLQTLARSEQQLDNRSLERVWQQVQAKREQDAISAQSNEHNLQAPWKQPEEKIIDIKRKEAIEGHNIPWRMNSSTPLAQAKKRGSLVRTVGMSLVAAVAVITILSFSVFSGILRSTSSTLTGVTQQQQHTISNGNLVCSFNAREEAPPKGAEIWYPWLSWSTQGLIAMANDLNLQAISANNCSLAFSQSSLRKGIVPLWSPDGKMLVVLANDSFTTYAVDNHGKIIAQNLPAGPVMVWTSDSKNLIYSIGGSKNQLNINSVNVSNGGQITTLMHMPMQKNPPRPFPVRISPDHRFLLVEQVYTAKKADIEIWDINSGKKISTIVPQNNKSRLYGLTFSPDGSQVAANADDGKLQIFATATGKLLTSFANSSWADNFIWSPDGKYIAESTDAIQIFDVHAKKVVATFGKVDKQHAIAGLTWAPDSTGLASVTMPLANNAPPYCTVNVWRLS